VKTWNVQVDTLADRAAYDNEAAGFVVLVSDAGDGRAAIFTMGAAGWSDPAYQTPASVGGNMLGPATSNDGHAVVFDGTDGKHVKDAGYVPASVGKAIALSMVFGD
jgi:hypothetical protein